MDRDDEICLCFHVTLRKVVNFIRVEKPLHASQLSDCFGAGTGCGWCRPYLRQLLQHYGTGATCQSSELPCAADYARRRGDYVRAGLGTPPPGATPIEGTGRAARKRTGTIATSHTIP